MKKISQRKTGRATPPTIDQEEVDAAMQLIQLSGDSAGETPKANNIASPPSDLGGAKTAEEAEEEESFGTITVNGGGAGGNYSSISSSVDDQISSTTITTTMNDDVADNLDDDEAFPSRKRKFRSVSDLYLKTKPLFTRLQKKGKKKVELIIN